jgi:hypothetical protein
MYGYVVVILLLILLAALAYYYFTQMRGELSPDPSPEHSPDPSTGSTLTITEEGASLTEGYRMMPRREGYVQLPQVFTCGTESAKDYCSAYDVSDTNGYAYVYDLSMTDVANITDYTECPSGGHDCWFIEKYDSEGTLIDVVNKEGVNMVDKMADDIWGDKWNIEEHPMHSRLKPLVEFKDGQFITKKELTIDGDTRLQAGDVIKPIHLPASIYYMLLFTAMKNAGIEKPSKIILNVKNAKDIFDRHKNRYSQPVSMTSA